ncbi:Eco47II family restriction endonuclease [Shewanella khirikhana]|uniref:Eco47II restriction endonuclease n=1 Tax=Shewanella khirikhana TaxID=1965282 RepID=A0ABM7DX92_9GAMM|nr:Eco47II family restriction endonuclease [Shewanella khirikhana]AZQ13107.1 Eco47II restriction endonuclease [Shewanella khirikhana]
MSQEVVLNNALTKLINAYKNKIDGFNVQDFLKTGVDPFRFTVNVSIWGLTLAVRKEIEHKIEMALENLIGDFHEDYLGNVMHIPTSTKWEKVPEGSIPGIDIANREKEVYFQIKSKHNSMNSSSSKKLAEELEETSQMYPTAEVGCLWVVATQERKAIGENQVAEVASCYKGNKSYEVVTGVDGELTSVLSQTLKSIPDIIKTIDFGTYKNEKGEEVKKDFPTVLDDAAKRVTTSLMKMAKETGISEIEIVKNNSIS